MVFSSIERIRDRAARSGRIHRRDEAVLLQRRPIGGSDQIETLAAQTRGLPAAILQRHIPREHAASDGLLEASLSRDRCGCLGECRCHARGECKNKFSAVHEPSYLSITNANKVSPAATTRYC